MAANWKMFKTRSEASSTITELCTKLTSLPSDRQVLIFVPFTSIGDAVNAVDKSIPLAIGAQNFYPAEEGAFTGEISLPMVKDVQATWVLVGHSERRHIFGESIDFIEKKSTYALENEFNVVFCVGETLTERENGQLKSVLEAQLACLSHLPSTANADTFAVAYEPVWAIGTGKVAGPQEIVGAHGIVRNILIEKMGEQGKKIRILYGGSVKPENTAEIIGLDNVDGVLVGGASLQAESFARIVQA